MDPICSDKHIGGRSGAVLETESDALGCLADDVREFLAIYDRDVGFLEYTLELVMKDLSA